MSWRARFQAACRSWVCGFFGHDLVIPTGASAFRPITCRRCPWRVPHP